MPAPNSAQYQEVAILTRAVENVFRKLIRFLVGRISLVKLQEMIKIIYIQEAEAYIRLEDEMENVSMTKLGVVTGIDTRTLTAVINSSAFRNPIYHENQFLRDLTPTTSIIDTWSVEEPFFDTKNGSPRVLQISGGASSFENLVNVSVKSRGITATSLLQRLESSEAVSVDLASGTVTLEQSTYLPKDLNDHLGFIELGLSAVSNLIESVHSNLKYLQKGEPRWYQRGAWTFRLPSSKAEEARLILSELLERTEKEARAYLSKLEESVPSQSQITSGVGLFYFEEWPKQL